MRKTHPSPTLTFTTGLIIVHGKKKQMKESERGLVLNLERAPENGDHSLRFDTCAAPLIASIPRTEIAAL
jgi:hypothetical protein